MRAAASCSEIPLGMGDVVCAAIGSAAIAVGVDAGDTSTAVSV